MSLANLGSDPQTGLAEGDMRAVTDVHSHSAPAAEPTDIIAPVRWQLLPVLEDGAPLAFVPRRLRPGINSIGREPGNHIVVRSELVSRHHAKLVSTARGVEVHDLDSHNGVFLDGTKVRSATLQPGQRLYIADVCCELRAIETDQEPTGVHDALEALRLEPVAEGRATGEEGASRSALRQALEAGGRHPSDDAYFARMIEICRAATDANRAALVLSDESGELSRVVEAETETATQPQGDGEGEALADDVLFWAVVRRALELKSPLVSSASLAEPGPAAVCCVPLSTPERNFGVLYVARQTRGPAFSGGAVQTLLALSDLLFARLEPTLGLAGASGDSGQQAKIASLEAELLAAQQRAGAQTSELTELRRACEELRAAARGSAGVGSGALEAAMARVVPARTVEIVRRLAAGAALPEVTAEMRTILTLSLSGLDGWVRGVAPEAVKARLDWLAERVYGVCPPLGGEVEQVHGHGLMVRFGGDRAGAFAAAHAGLRIVSEAAALGGQAQAGLHCGLDVSGPFGPLGSLMHAGDACAVSRAALEYAPPGAVYASDSVREALVAEQSAASAAILPVALGPFFIRSMGLPVHLYQLIAQGGGQI